MDNPNDACQVEKAIRFPVRLSLSEGNESKVSKQSIQVA